MWSQGWKSCPSGCTPTHHASSPAPPSLATVGFILSLRNTLLYFSIVLKCYCPPINTGGPCWFLTEDEGRRSCRLEKAGCCLQGGKAVGMISFYCESGGGSSCSLVSLILLCLGRKGKKYRPSQNIHQGKQNSAKKECLGNNFFRAKGSYLMRMLCCILQQYIQMQIQIYIQGERDIYMHMHWKKYTSLVVLFVTVGFGTEGMQFFKSHRRLYCIKKSEEKNEAISVNQIVGDLAYKFFTFFEKISGEKV